METVIDDAGNANPADRVNEVDSSGNGKHTGGENDDTTPIEARASVVCTPTLPVDEVEHLKRLLAASQERLGVVEGELVASQGRESALTGRVAAAIHDFDRLQANVFWSTKEEVVVDLQEDLRVAHVEVAQVKEKLGIVEEELLEANQLLRMGDFFMDRAKAQVRATLYGHIRTLGGLALEERVLAREMNHRGQGPGDCERGGCKGCVL